MTEDRGFGALESARLFSTRNDFYGLEGEWVVADSKAFSAGGSEVSDQRFLGADVRVGLVERGVRHLGRKVAEEGGAVVVRWLVGVVDI